MGGNDLMGMIKDILAREWECDCLGCSIANHEIDPPGGIIYEDDAFIVHQDPIIPINGFIILTCKRHITSITELSDLERYKLIESCNKVVSYLKELRITEEITIIQEERSKHLHIWIFPHHSWMSEKLGKDSRYARDICRYAKENPIQSELTEILKTVSELQKRFSMSG